MICEKLLIFAVVFLLVVSFASAGDYMVLQGNVNQLGVALSSGNLQVVIYDAPSAGNIVYNSSSDFNSAVSAGKYDVVLGNGTQELNLNYGQKYYLELYVNGEKFTFGGLSRQIFQSSVGNVSLSSVQGSGSFVFSNDSATFAAGQNVSTGAGGWFKGAFQWFVTTLGSRYLSFNGTTLDFNEANLNSTIDARTVVIYNDTWSSTYNATYALYAYNQTENKFYYNQTDVTKAYVNAGANNNWTDLRSFVSSSLNANITDFYTLNSTFWYNQTEFTRTQVNSAIAGNTTNITTKDYVNSAVDSNTTIKANITGGNAFTGQQTFDGDFATGGVRILNGDIFAQQIYIYNISALSVINIQANGSLLPYLNNTFDIGNLTSVWGSGYFGNDVNIKGRGVYQWLYNQTEFTRAQVNSAVNGNASSWQKSATAIYNDTAGVNVGIGTNNPSYALEINNSATALNVSGNLYANSSTIWTTGRNVGIGTLTPVNFVEIQGNTTGVGGSGSVLFLNQTGAWSGNNPYTLEVAGYSYLNGFRINGADGIRSLYLAAGQLGFAVGDTSAITFTQSVSKEKMRIDTTGNVGIGTVAPAYKLEVNSSATALNISGMLYANSTNVGIGTDNPTATLDVNGNVHVSPGSWVGQSVYYGLVSSLNPWYVSLNSGADLYLHSDSDGGSGGNNIYFGYGSTVASGTQIMTINTNTRKVGIGTTAPSYALEISNGTNSLNVSGMLYANSTNVGINTNLPTAQLQLGQYDAQNVLRITGTVTANQAPILSLYRNGATVWAIGIGDTGGIHFAQTSTFSDANLNASVLTLRGTTGRVGITSNNPQYNLEVNGTSNVLNVSGMLYANSTNIGIGTSNSRAPLHISDGTASGIAYPAGYAGGTITDNAAALLYFEDVGATTGQRVFRFTNDGGDFSIGSQNDGASAWVNQYIMNWQYDGKVGIGTSTPAYLLEIKNNESALNVSGMLYANSTNVGIGTSNPKTPLQIGVLDVNDINNVDARQTIIGSTVQSTTNEVLLRLTRDTLAGSYYPATVDFNVGAWKVGNGATPDPATKLTISLKSATSYNLQATTDVMTLMSNGNVGIGTTNATYRLEVNSANKALNVSGNLFANSTNVGIGTAKPTAELEVYSSTAVTSGTLYGLNSSLSNAAAGVSTVLISLYGFTSSTGLAGAASTYGGYFKGIVGNAGAQNAYGIYTNASGGTNNYGIYATAENGTNKYAGYFAEGNVSIEDNLGIGTAKPLYSLEVNSSSRALNVSGMLYANSTNVGVSESNPLAQFSLGGAVGQKQLVYQGTADYNSGFGTNLGQAPNSGTSIFIGYGTGAAASTNFEIVSADDSWPFAAYTTRFTVQRGGNVGIGNVAPAYKLEINSSVTALNVSGRLYVNSTNVGIGTTKSKSNLEVYSFIRTGNGDIYGINSTAMTDTIGSTSAVYGVYGLAANLGTAETGTVYGGYFTGTGNNLITPSIYGIYASASGGLNNYAGYFDDGVVAIVNNVSIGDPTVKNVPLYIKGFPINGSFLDTIRGDTFTPSESIQSSATFGRSWPQIDQASGGKNDYVVGVGAVTSDASPAFNITGMLGIYDSVHNFSAGVYGNVTGTTIDSTGNGGVNNSMRIFAGYFEGNVKVIGELIDTGISGDGSGKVVCVTSTGVLGTCSSGVGGTGTCTCG